MGWVGGYQLEKEGKIDERLLRSWNRRRIDEAKSPFVYGQEEASSFPPETMGWREPGRGPGGDWLTVDGGRGGAANEH